MLESVPTPFDECKEVLKQSAYFSVRNSCTCINVSMTWTDIKLDPGFKDFFKWCKAEGVPIIIVSSGMAPLIRAVLSNLIGEEDAKTIDIISNEVDLGPADGEWYIKFRHPSR